jgi:hypothetical protein
VEEGALAFDVDRYWIPPSETIASNGPTSRPALTANDLVIVNRAAGSKFIFKSNDGDVVVDFPAAENPAFELMVPRLIPSYDTVD